MLELHDRPPAAPALTPSRRREVSAPRAPDDVPRGGGDSARSVHWATEVRRGEPRAITPARSAAVLRDPGGTSPRAPRLCASGGGARSNFCSGPKTLLTAVGRLLLATGRLLLAARYWPPATYRLLLAAYSSTPTTVRLLHAAC